MSILINQKRQIKYKYVLSVTGDSALASAARSWSNERINREYGVTVKYGDKAVQSIERKIPRTIKQRAKVKQRWLITVITRGKTVADDVSIKEKEKKEKRETPLVKNYKELPDDVKNFVHNNINESKDLPKKFKRANWQLWTKLSRHDKKEGFPDYVIKLVETANDLNNKEKEDSYGYVVVFYMYLYNISMEEAFKHLTPDRFTPDIYESSDWINSLKY